MASGGMWVWILRRSGRRLMAKPSLFRLRAVFFRSLGGFFVSGTSRFLLRKTGAISFFAVRIDRCLRGFWRQIKEAPGISHFLGDVREGYGFRLNDGAGETVF